MPPIEDSPHLVLLMGVAGSGKTTLARMLASRLAYHCIDADDFHDADAITRMRSGLALTGTMRDAWVDRLAAALTDYYRQGTNCVLAFSGLRARHRRRLMDIGFATSAFMLEGGKQLLTQRLEQREEHFMPASQLQNQLEAMEPVQPDEEIAAVDIRDTPENIVAVLAASLTP